MEDIDEYTEEIVEDDINEVYTPKGFIEPEDFSFPLYAFRLEYSKDIFYALVPAGLTVKRGTRVITPTRFGADMAIAVAQIKKSIRANSEDIKTIIRLANQADFDKQKENLVREENACMVFKEKIAAQNLKMKLISSHFLLEEPKILFFFSADTRIDFRKLVKELVAVFKIRVELRQVGVRDEAKMIGGLGCCGRPYCCASISDKMKTVSIKMVKEQGVSLNSLKVSGQCGRLLCCLGYEYEWYAESTKEMPPDNIKLYYDNATFKIIEINHFSKNVTLKSDDDRLLTVPSYRIKRHGDTWKII